MLILARYPRQSVFCGDTKIVVSKVRGKKIWLGFEGPDVVVLEERKAAEDDRKTEEQSKK